jgi:hypothetical protein
MGKKDEPNYERSYIAMLGAAYWGTSNDITSAVEIEKLAPLDDPGKNEQL